MTTSLEYLPRASVRAVYVLSGEAEIWYGEGLREYLVCGKGDFVYIPAGVASPTGQPQPD